jgi:hypothetical protein
MDRIDRRQAGGAPGNGCASGRAFACREQNPGVAAFRSDLSGSPETP